VRRRARPALPIIEHTPVGIDAEEQRQLVRRATQLLADEPALSATAAFGPGVMPGWRAGPNFLLEDHSEIALFHARGNPLTEYRSLLLAGEGDIVALSVPRCSAFEAYCREVLGLGRVEVVSPTLSATRSSLAIRCTQDPELVQRVAALARHAGGLNVVPYMGTGGVWRLAATVARGGDRTSRGATTASDQACQR
jgi:hypothetical protein